MTLDTRTSASQDFDSDMTLMRRKQVELQSGNSRSTIYLRIAQGTFPAPIQLGARAVAWPQREVRAVNAARIAGKSDSEIRTLFAQLVAARKASHV